MSPDYTYAIEDLEVVAYGAITEAMTPAIVRPVFECRVTRDIVHPSKITDWGTVVHAAFPMRPCHLAEDVKKRKYTMCDVSFQARPEFVLCVDISMKTHYEHEAIVKGRHTERTIEALEAARLLADAQDWPGALAVLRAALSVAIGGYYELAALELMKQAHEAMGDAGRAGVTQTIIDSIKEGA